MCFVWSDLSNVGTIADPTPSPTPTPLATPSEPMENSTGDDSVSTIRIWSFRNSLFNWLQRQMEQVRSRLWSLWTQRRAPQVTTWPWPADRHAQWSSAPRKKQRKGGYALQLGMIMFFGDVGSNVIPRMGWSYVANSLTGVQVCAVWTAGVTLAFLTFLVFMFLIVGDMFSNRLRSWHP